MRTSRIIKIAAVLVLATTGCTKLDEKLNSTLTYSEEASAIGTSLLLQTAYGDLAVPFTNQDQLFCLEGNTADEALVPTRGGDWDDNGVWRVLHNHTWNADHAYVLNVFNNLNKMQFDATNVLAFSPTKQQAAEARFLRALSLYYLLDLYGQYPFRPPGDNLLNAPSVKSGATAAQFIIDELNAILTDLPAFDAANRNAGQASQEAAKMLLMKCYLNRGAWTNRASPTFADADMQQVITLGNSLISGGKFSYMSEYFKNFDVNNGASTENIFTYVNSSGVSARNSGPHARWEMTMHYNEYVPKAPNAGWNGFSTVSDFYNSFGTTATPMVGVTKFIAGDISGHYADSALDSRVGNRPYSGLTEYSGIKPGFLIGQQYDQNGNALKDRKNPPNALAFDPRISSDQKETGNNLELTGIRVIKYPPDFSDPSGKFFQSNAGNDIVILRYSDVTMMVAEAYLRQASPNSALALTLVNSLRLARKAPALPSISLVNTSNIYDSNTLLTERGREFYWETMRRTDLIRFGVFTKTWQYKPTDDPKYLVFPIPSQALGANPNLVQNAGY